MAIAIATPTPEQPSRRAAAAQATVDRYAASPSAKRVRSLALCEAHGLTLAARALVIDRDASGLLTTAVYLVASQSAPSGKPHLVTFNPDSDSASCDCPAGLAGLPCGHAGAAILAGRVADRYLTVKLDAAQVVIVGYTGPIGQA